MYFATSYLLNLLEGDAKAIAELAWLRPNFTRCMRITEPIFPSTTRSRLRLMSEYVTLTRA